MKRQTPHFVCWATTNHIPPILYRDLGVVVHGRDLSDDGELEKTIEEHRRDVLQHTGLVFWLQPVTDAALLRRLVTLAADLNKPVVLIKEEGIRVPAEFEGIACCRTFRLAVEHLLPFCPNYNPPLAIREQRAPALANA